MPNYKSKFNKNWIKLFPWVCEVDSDLYKAYCKWCKCEIKVDVRGVGGVKQHRNTAKHKSIAAKISSPKQDSTGMREIHFFLNYHTMLRRFINVHKCSYGYHSIVLRMETDSIDAFE